MSYGDKGSWQYNNKLSSEGFGSKRAYNNKLTIILNFIYDATEVCHLRVCSIRSVRH